MDSNSGSGIARYCNTLSLRLCLERFYTSLTLAINLKFDRQSGICRLLVIPTRLCFVGLLLLLIPLLVLICHFLIFGLVFVSDLLPFLPQELAYLTKSGIRVIFLDLHHDHSMVKSTTPDDADLCVNCS